jgi:nanoRNase/pAp phosphatase (c-di-AMP/oligoRNAs hydrolase)
MGEFVAQLTPLFVTARRVWMFMHTSPDLDAVGSHVGVAAWIRHLNPTCQIRLGGADRPRDNLLGVAAAVDPQLYQHLDPADVAFAPGDVVVLVDVADIGRTSHHGVVAVPAEVPVVVIDHHRVTCDAPVQYIDASYQSAAALVYDLLMLAEVPFTQAHFRGLIMGVLGDSGFFRFYDQRLPASLAMIQHFCTLYGVAAYYDLVDLLERNRPVSDYIVQGAYLRNLVISERFAYSTLSLADVAAMQLADDVVSGVNGAGLLRNIGTTEFVFVVKESSPGHYRSSWRTCAGARTSVRAIVAPHGGGGHESAAGYAFAAPSMEAAVAHLLACIAAVDVAG